MWMNLPISILFVSGLRILCNEVEFSWKVRQSVRRPSYLSHLEKKQLSLNDSRLSSTPPPPKWKRKIDSPVVEAAISDFIDQILKDFVVDLWYSEITPDREAPELMRSVIMDALGEISGRAKEINLIDLLTRDIVDLIGDHLDLFRRNQAAIGADVMATLSTEERDERLKHHLIASKELHPALISPESEYKVLQQLVGGVLAIVLRPREAQCPLVWTIAREIVTCLVMQPLINLASPAYINEVLEMILLAIKDDSSKDAGGDHPSGSVNNVDFTSRKDPSLNNQRTDKTLAKIDDHKETYLDYNSHQQEPMQPHPAEWARILEVATQRRTEVLAPENLENMWAKGRNYKKKENRYVKAGAQKSMAKSSVTNTAMNLRKDMPIHSNMMSTKMEEKALVHLTLGLSLDTLTSHENRDGSQFTRHGSQELSFEGSRVGGERENAGNLTLNENKGGIKRSNSTSALKALPDKKKAFTGDCGGSIISEFYSPESYRSADHAVKKVSDIILRGEGPYSPKLKCRVKGAYFEKLGSNSFAVYSIEVTDSENRTRLVKRRYRNFERLHKHLKEIPNYTLQLPPKRIFSSSTDDAFVHQRCIQLDKYLQDLLSIANVAEQHEVWDFLSASSKNYSFGKSSSVMRTLAVNVDGAVDDIVRQFKDGFMRKVVGSTSPFDETDSSIYSKNMSWHSDDVSKHVLRQDTLETANSFSDTEESHNQENQDHKGVGSTAQASGWHSDNELNAKDFPPRVIKWGDESQTLGLDKKHVLEEKSKRINHGGFSVENSAVGSSHLDDPVGMPPEWTPSNVSLPLLNLVDKVFQLKRRGWLRRQVFWISKQILQLIMEDAIDEWLLSQINWIRSEETVALGIRWVQDILWPDGIFFTRTGSAQSKADNDQPNPKPFQINQLGGSKVSNKGLFEEQLEAARRASDIKKMLFDGAPTTLVSLIGNKQYKRCARDIFYFTQSTICVKQLTYGILELLALSVFPELRDLLLGLNEKMRAPPA
ncbi:PX SERINE/THREONINE KINASE PXK [Salix koriyanagi]|uniref:PX SERINE/THREONINE KINASE PXK n=1 Tax=Salix koriyanagi TaxID=2511006 RepID=A0A9Q0TRY0_9ROSI|nr:PX SERINE/THREONINE KINASE PXK [Salix koriyanagi]